MSRIANSPVEIPAGVEVSVKEGLMTVKGPKGTLNRTIHEFVEVSQDGGVLTFSARNKAQKGAVAMSGTMRSLVFNMVSGVVAGFEKKLTLVGVGYRAQMQGKVLNLTLGFSHPVSFESPEGVSLEAPSQTEIVIKGADKQAVGQVAAKIRAFRPPEPYKGKGVRYADEHVVMKEAKMK